MGSSTIIEKSNYFNGCLNLKHAIIKDIKYEVLIKENNYYIVLDKINYNRKITLYVVKEL